MQNSIVQSAADKTRAPAFVEPIASSTGTLPLLSKTPAFPLCNGYHRYA